MVRRDESGVLVGQSDEIDREQARLIRDAIRASRRESKREADAQAKRAIAGTAGGALALRPSSPEQVATGDRRRGKEAAYTVRYADAHLIDRMWQRGQFSDRQYEAACRVAEMHDMAGLGPKQVGGYAPSGWSRDSGLDEADEPPAVRRFRKMLGECSPAYAWWLHAMCLEQHPGVRWLATLHAALDFLADQWKIDR